jgi:flagellar FliJ protein
LNKNKSYTDFRRENAMERFQFNLQRVLDFRIDIEEKRKQEFIAAQKNLLKQEMVLKDLYDKRENANLNIKYLKISYEYQSLIRYKDLLNQQIEKQNIILTEAKNELDKKMNALTLSISDRKVLEKLKEKAKEEFDSEVKKKEQNQNDDFALYAFVRNERR